MNEDTITSLDLPGPSDSSLLALAPSITNSVVSTENSPTLINSTPASSSNGLGGIISSVGNDVLGITALATGQSVSIPGVTVKPASVTTSETTTILVLGALAIAALFIFKRKAA